MREEEQSLEFKEEINTHTKKKERILTAHIFSAGIRRFLAIRAVFQ